MQHTCISITVSIVWKNFKSCQPQLEFLYVRKISGLVSNLTIALLIQISVHLFCSKYDLYSKSKVRIDVEKVKPYYLSLINKVCSASVPSSLEYGNQNMYVQNIFKLVKTAEMLSTVILSFAVMESKCLPQFTLFLNPGFHWFSSNWSMIWNRNWHVYKWNFHQPIIWLGHLVWHTVFPKAASLVNKHPLPHLPCNFTTCILSIQNLRGSLSRSS